MVQLQWRNRRTVERKNIRTERWKDGRIAESTRVVIVFVVVFVFVVVVVFVFALLTRRM